MVFSSTEFVWLFLPIILLLYGFVSLFERNTNLIKNILLLVFSLIFYAWGEPKYILLMLFSITINYILGLLVGRCGLSGRMAAVKTTQSTEASIFSAFCP